MAKSRPPPIIVANRTRFVRTPGNTEPSYVFLRLIGNMRYDDVIFRTVPGSGLRLGNSGAKRTFGKLRLASAI